MGTNLSANISSSFLFYFSLDRKVAQDQEPHEALAAQGLPNMASVPAVTAFELSRFVNTQASPSLLKQGDLTHKADAPDAIPGCMRLELIHPYGSIRISPDNSDLIPKFLRPLKVMSALIFYLRKDVLEFGLNLFPGYAGF
jgi:hypothetical protein